MADTTLKGTKYLWDFETYLDTPKMKEVDRIRQRRILPFTLMSYFSCAKYRITNHQLSSSMGIGFFYFFIYYHHCLHMARCIYSIYKVKTMYQEFDSWPMPPGTKCIQCTVKVGVEEQCFRDTLEANFPTTGPLPV